MQTGWSTAAASVSSNTVSLVPSTQQALSGHITAVRYSWSGVPTGKFVYDTTGLPASPFIAQCTPATSAADLGKCELIPPGRLPGPPTPPPTVAPTPSPPSTACAFKNGTMPKGHFYGKIDIPLNHLDVCCGACRADKMCAGALVQHGGGNAPFDFCEFFNASEMRKGLRSVRVRSPSVETTCIPT